MNDLLTIAILVACLGDDRFAVRQAAHDALKAKDDVALSVLGLHAHSSNPEQRRRVEALMATRRPKDHLTVLLASHQPLPWIDAMPEAIPGRWRIQGHYLQQARKLAGNGAAPAWHDYRAATHLWIVDMAAAGVPPETLDALLTRMTRRSGNWDGSTARPVDPGQLLDEAILDVLQLVPRPNAEECDSVEKQLERCRAYCAGHGYDVLAVHFDKDLSGGRADNRPGLQDAIDLACRQRAILCVYSLSRFARCTKDAIDLAERLHAAGADLAVIQENVNTRSPMGRFIFTLFSALAQLEREQIGERTSNAMLRHQANGRRMTHAARCPFGKQADPTDPARLIDHPAEQSRASRLAHTPTRTGSTSLRPKTRSLSLMPARTPSGG